MGQISGNEKKTQIKIEDLVEGERKGGGGGGATKEIAFDLKY